MKLNTRQLVTIAVFGALWGLVEMSLGGVLKSANVPMSGTVLSSIAVIILCAGRQFVPVRGASLFMGVIAMLLKLLSLGGVLLGPMVGIFTEALFAEIAFSAFGKPTRLASMLAGLAGVGSTVVQPFITGPIFWGRNFPEIWGDLIRNGSRVLGLDPNNIFIVFFVYVGIHILMGLVAGWLGWEIGKLLRTRQARDLSEAI